MKTKTFTLQYPWDTNGYKPDVTFQLGMDEDGFHIHITAQECNPRREEKEHLNFVHYDSCVEWFVNFSPETCDRYFNFEVNANGTMYAAFRKDRHEFQLLTKEDVEELNIQANINADNWEIRYTVSHSWIRKYIPDYSYSENKTIRANFYKCGDNTEFPHYGMWNQVETAEPDFHRPEFFGEVIF